MDMQPLQTALERMAWAPVVGLVIGLVMMAVLVSLAVWLRHKFPPPPTRIEIVHVQPPTNETVPPKPKEPDDSRYMPK